MKITIPGRGRKLSAFFKLTPIAIGLAAAVSLRADVPAPSISQFQAHPDGSVLLKWNATQGSAYRVLMATNLGDNSWAPVDQIVATSNSVSWQANGQGGPVRFYRLATEGLGIESIEPSLFCVTSSTTNLYITGQGFGSNDVITIGGVVQTNVQFLSATLIQVTVNAISFPTDGAAYDVQITNPSSGQQSTLKYAWSLVSSPTASRLFLEPPVEPPASPTATLLMPALMKAKEKANQVKCMFSGTASGPRGSRPNVSNNRMAGGGGAWGSCFNCHPFGVESASMKNKKGGITLFDGSNNRSRAPAKTCRYWAAVNFRCVDKDKDGDPSTTDCDDNDPAVFPWSGEVQMQAVDLAIPGRGLDFVWGRTYRSRTSDSSGMAPGWVHSYDIHIQPLGGDIVVFDGTGRSDRYYHGANGLYTRPEFFNEGSLKNNAFTLTFPDTGKWVFNPMDSSVTSGKLAQIVDRNGNTMSFGYDGAGRLWQVVDDLQRTNFVGYNSAGQLSTLTDFSGRTVTYQYYGQGKPGGTAGDLKLVTSPPVTGTPNGNDFPAGKTTTYTYSSGFANDAENHLLLTVTDGKNQVKYTHVYQHNQTDLEFLRCISSQYGTNAPVYFTHVPLTPVPSNLFATIQVTVRDSLGNVTDCTYDSRNRLVDMKQYTGRAPLPGPVTATSNRPTGKLRTEDPDYYETQWSWNSDSLCVSEVAPGGDATLCVYQSDFDKSASARKKGDLRVVRELPCCADLDRDGFPDLLTRLDYDPRFGSPPAGNARKDMMQWYQDRIGGKTGMAKGRDLLNDKFKDGDIPTESDFEKVNHHAGEECDNVQTSGLSVRGQDGSNLLLGKTSAGWSKMHPKLHQEAVDPFAATQVIDPRGISGTGTYDGNGNLLRWTWNVDATPPEVTMGYNSFGQLTRITNAADANGYQRVDNYSYYTNGPSTGYCRDWTIDIMGPTLIATTYEYDARGNVTRRIDPRGNDILCVYNTLDQLMQSSSPSLGGGGLQGYRIVSQYSYDAADNLTSCALENRDATGTLDSTLPLCTTACIYDELNRCVRVERARDASHTVAMECAYDANDNLVLYRSGEAVNGDDTNKTTQFTYDERNLPFTITEGGSSGQAAPVVCNYTADGDTGTMKYGDTGSLTQVSCAYDGFQRLMTVTDQMGNVVSNRYDANGNVVLCTMFGETNDVPGSTGNVVLGQSSYQYDAMDRCLSESRVYLSGGLPVGKGVSTSSYVYAPNGDCVSVTDDNGHTTRHAYDTVGRLATVTDPKSNTVTCTYDANGNVLTVTQTDKSDLGGADQMFVTTMQYDALDRCFSSSDNVGNTMQYAYDSRNNLTRQMDPNGNLRGWFYDGLSRCVLSIADMNGDGLLDLVADAGMARTFDDNGCVLTETDANTNTTSYVYDAVDRMVSRSRADGTHMSLVWSPRSNIRMMTDANGTTVTNTHDLKHNLIHRDIAARSGVATTTTFETFAYDGCGRMTLASNDVSQVTFGYDTLGNYSSRTQDGLTVAYSYDGAGNCLGMTYPSLMKLKYGYDGADCLTSVNTAQGQNPFVPQMAFDYVGRRPLDIYRANGANTRFNYDGLSGTQNPTGDLGWQQVARINHAFTNSGEVIDQRQLGYDGNQNKILRGQLVEFVQGQGLRTNRWTYDPLNAMAHAINTKGTGTAGITEDYSLDAMGNRKSVTSNGVVLTYTRDATTPSPADFQVDQYTTTPFENELHDDNGNLVQSSTASSGTSYIYDYADRLVEVDDLSTGAAMPVVSFTYDALGERLTKTVYPTTPPLAPVTTYFVHGGNENDKDCGGTMLEARAGGPGGAVNQTYFWSGKRFGIGVQAPEAPLGMIAGTVNMRFFHADELGNVLAVSAVNGSVQERYDYDDFGQPAFLMSDGTPTSATSSSLGNPFLFGGMEWDGESGLYYASAGYRTRWGYCGSSPAYMNARSGRYLMRAGVPLKFGGNEYVLKGNHPWSVELCDAATDEDVLGGRSSVGNGSSGIFLSKGTKGSQVGGSAGEGISAVVSRNILKSFFTPGAKPTSGQFFERGDKPTQEQFGSLIDSL